MDGLPLPDGSFVTAMSNCCDVTPAEFAAAQTANEARTRQGYDAQGRLGGPYSKDRPPPGMRFAGYHKGCTGITWEKASATGSLLHKATDAIGNVAARLDDYLMPAGLTLDPVRSAQQQQQQQQASSSTTAGPGYCDRCGHSLYHYAGQPCAAHPATKHPAWQGEAPPSYAEANQ